jgi:hypothetical protein
MRIKSVEMELAREVAESIEDVDAYMKDYMNGEIDQCQVMLSIGEKEITINGKVTNLRQKFHDDDVTIKLTIGESDERN